MKYERGSVLEFVDTAIYIAKRIAVARHPLPHFCMSVACGCDAIGDQCLSNAS